MHKVNCCTQDVASIDHCPRSLKGGMYEAVAIAASCKNYIRPSIAFRSIPGKTSSYVLHQFSSTYGA
eukprot:scaffold98822_cov14-Tisochrysis_lutea.AAC.1